MQSKIVIALALLTVAAAPGAALAGATQNASTSNSGDTGNIRMADQFRQLDTDDDGLLSREEAQADPAIGRLYDSFDTSDTMEEYARNDRPGGITEEQFEAGLQALASDSGAIGAAASGGETLLVYPDGTMERVKGTGIKSRD